MANNFYTKSGTPGTGAQGASAAIRAEYALLEAAFDKMPTLTANGDKAIFVNAGATALTAVTAADARTKLGLAIGTNVQAYSADLTAIAALTSAADKAPYATGAGTWALTSLNSAGRTLIANAEDAGLLVQRPESSSVARTQHAKNLEACTIDDFTSFANAVADNIDMIYYPEGTFTITASQNVPTGAGIDIDGAGMDATTLQASGTFDQIFKLGDTTAQCTRGTISNMTLSGSGATVGYGFYGARADHWSFKRVRCTGFVLAGGSTGYGWSNNYDDCEFSYNTGHGIKLNVDHSTGGNNAINIQGCRIFNNTLFGIWARSGIQINVIGGTIETNAAGGIYFDAVSGFTISSYFEGNAATGTAFTTPVKTVRSDIVLVGSVTNAQMGVASPSQAGVIQGCTVTPTAGNTSFIYDAGAIELEIGPNKLNSGTLPLLAWQYTNSYHGYSHTITGCDSFTSFFSVQDVVADHSDTKSPLIRLLNNGFGNTVAGLKIAKRINYAKQDFNKDWILLAAGSATAFRKSEDSAIQTVDNAHVWNLNSTAASSSEIWGFRIPYSDYPNLVGKLVWFGMWKYAVDGTNAFATGYCNKQTFSQSTHASGSWLFDAVSFIWPSSGNVDCGILKQGGGTNQIYFHSPMLMEVGVPIDEALGMIKTDRVWGGTAAPTTGYWLQGDRVSKTDVAAAGTPGYYNSATGGPGVFAWKAESNVAA